MKEISFEIKIPKIEMNDKRKGNIKIFFSFLIVVGAYFFRQNFDLSFAETLILAYLGLSILWNLSSYIATALALFFLVSAMILLMLKQDPIAEISAIYAYYFMFIFVLQEIVCFSKKHPAKTGDFGGIKKELVSLFNRDKNIEKRVKTAYPRPSKSPVDNFPRQVKRKIV